MNATDTELSQLLALESRINDVRYAQTVMITGLKPSNPGASRGGQTRDILEQMERRLAEAGLEFRHVIRTWFYLRDILGWYGEFNQARTAFFTERGVFDPGRLLPASTGIGLDRMDGEITAAVLAVNPLNRLTRIQTVHSPLQCPAPDYRSSFSRAVEVLSPAGRRLYVSGTASIAPGGASVHHGDVDAQIALTFKVVGALLAVRGLGWKDTTRAVGYFRSAEDISKIASHLPAGLPVGVQCLESVICRDDLLFELELDAER